MFSFKKFALAVVLVSGIGSAVNAADLIETSWSTTGTKKTAAKAITASVGEVHSVAVKSGSIAWQVDVRIQGAKNRECTVAIELCNAAGQPYLNRDGTPIRLEESITPDTDSYHVTDLSFQISAQRFWDLYGRGTKELTFRVIVTEEKSGKTLNASTVMNLNGLGTALPSAPPEKTDVPSLPPGRFGNVWMRLIFA